MDQNLDQNLEILTDDVMSVDITDADSIESRGSPEDVFQMTIPYSDPSQIYLVEMTDVVRNYQPPTEDLITSEETIVLLDKSMKSYFSNPGLQKKDQIGENVQMENEKNLLKQISVCPVEKLDAYNELLTSINPDSLKKAVSKQFFNPNVMESVMCLVDSFYYITPGFKPHQRVRNWISDLKRIGAESVSGYALRGTFSSNQSSDENEEKLFIIKTPRSSRFNDELIHEAFVGMFALNQLRKYIPNFTYVYGLFECSPALIDPDNKNVETWCTTSGNTNYLVIENISPAVSFSTYTRTASPKEFVSLYLQTLYAVRTGLSYGDFTHYDLHDENVLIRNISQLGPGQLAAIPYNTERGVEYWIGKDIATIIDYGRVHIMYDRQHYGFWKAPYYFIYPERSFPLYDAYKLLGFSMRRMISSNNLATFDEAAKILKFFNITEDPIDFILKTQQNNYTLPLTPKVENKTLDDLLTHIREVCDTSSYLRPTRDNYPLLYCDEDTICLSEQGVFRHIGADLGPSPNSVFQFCDWILKIKNNPTRFTKYQNLIQNFDFESILEKAIDDFTKKSRIIDQQIKELNNTRYRIYDVKLENFLNYQAYSVYRKYIFNVVNIIGKINDLNTLLEAFICTLNYFPNKSKHPRYPSYVDEYQVIVNNYIGKINPYIDSILRDIDYVSKLQFFYKREINQIITRFPELKWYWTTFPSFSYLKNVF